MSSFDNMQRTVEPEKVLEDMICVAIPLIASFGEYTVAKAIFNDAIGAGLSADEIRIAVKNLSDRYNKDFASLLSSIDNLAAVQIAAERYADAVEAICFNKEV